MSGFEFLDDDFSDIAEAARSAADLALRDPRASAFYARRAVDLCLRWMFTFDHELRPPYEPSLPARLNSPSFRDVVGETVCSLARHVAQIGDKAVHDGAEPTKHEAVGAVSALFHFCYWFARTYNQGPKPAPGLIASTASLRSENFVFPRRRGGGLRNTFTARKPTHA